MSSPCCRLNQYDGQKEFWVTVRETGQRTESLTRTTTHTKEMEALGNMLNSVEVLPFFSFHIYRYFQSHVCGRWQVGKGNDVQWNMGTDMKALSFAQNREDKRIEMQANQPHQDKYMQALCHIGASHSVSEEC